MEVEGPPGPCGFEAHRGHTQYSTDMTKSKEKPGPKPETVKIEGDWEDAVGKALAKKRPVGGWTKHSEEVDRDGQEKEPHADTENDK